MTAIHIAALGSSFAAGPGISPQVDRNAMRSGQNYASILSKRLGARLTDLSVSGATLNNVLDEPQEFGGMAFEPQLSGLPSDVDVVTLTAGGNDLKYIGTAIQDALKSSFLGWLVSGFFTAPSQEEPLTVEAVADRFIAIIDKIHEIAPRSRILLVEYLTILGPHTRSGIDVSFDESKVHHLRNIAATLQTAYKLAVKARPECRLVPVAEHSREHGLGSEEPWVDGFSMGILYARKLPFHPNLQGMQAIADLVYNELEDGLQTASKEV